MFTNRVRETSDHQTNYTQRTERFSVKPQRENTRNSVVLSLSLCRRLKTIKFSSQFDHLSFDCSWGGRSFFEIIIQNDLDERRFWAPIESTVLSQKRRLHRKQATKSKSKSLPQVILNDWPSNGFAESNRAHRKIVVNQKL